MLILGLVLLIIGYVLPIPALGHHRMNTSTHRPRTLRHRSHRTPPSVADATGGD